MLANGGELNGKRLAPSTVKLMKSAQRWAPRP